MTGRVKQVNTEHRRRSLRRLILVPLSIFLAGIIGVNVFILAWAEPKLQTAVELRNSHARFDCILVLGAGIWGDQPTPLLQDRLDQAITLYKAELSSRLLMSGDHSGNHNEVQVMKNYAMSQGVPAEAIFMDHSGFSTYESIMRAKEIFLVESALIVSQGYHLPRALFLAQAAGITALGSPSDLRSYRDMVTYQLREAGARVKDFAFAYLKPPAYETGPTVPISGTDSPPALPAQD